MHRHTSARLFHQPLSAPFCRHYQQQTQWMRSRGIVPVPVILPDGTVFSAEASEAEEKDEPVRREQAAAAQQVSLSTSPHHHAQNQGSESEEYEISAEYLDFIAVTRQHQKDREKRRAQRKRQERRTVYCDVSEVQRPAMRTDSRRHENEDLIRRLELTQWYGEQAGQRIAAMQDHMDQLFHRYRHEHKAAFFPACPIAMHSFFHPHQS